MKMKKFFPAFFFAVFFSLPLYAQDQQLRQLESLADKILGYFTGALVRTILVILFCATGIVFAYNKDNEKMKKNCIAILVGIAILGAASGIVGVLFDASGVGR